MSILQAVLFSKDLYDSSRARRWLRKNKIIPCKRVHETTRFLRYRIQEPDYDKYEYRIKRISDGVKMVFAYPIDDNMEL